MYPVLCEIIFNHHPSVARTALVGVGPEGAQAPVLLVEPHSGHFPADVLARQRFTMELLALGTEHEHTRTIEQVDFYPDTFPTDVRHNVKIQREKLAVWAAERHPRSAGGRLHVTPSPTKARDVSYTGPSTRKRHIGDLVGVLGISAGILTTLGVSIALLIKRLGRKDEEV